MAAAGIDASNVERDHVVLLPRDPDASARSLRARLRDVTGANVAVVVTDSAGRAWREGQTDIAIGAAGLPVVLDHRGAVDAHGNELAVTAPAVADEVAGAAELVQGKLSGRPFALVRGLAHLVLPAGDDGPGAAALVRPEAGDLFGYGAREAVARALVADPADRVGFGAVASAEELVDLLDAGAGRSRSRHPHPGGPGRRARRPAGRPAGLRVRVGAGARRGFRCRAPVATSGSVDFLLDPRRRPATSDVPPHLRGPQTWPRRPRT